MKLSASIEIQTFIGHSPKQAALIGAGEHVRVIAERLGTSMKMIDDTYSHVPQKLQQTATDRMAKMLHGT